jgi:hypothetical protein
MARLSLVWSMFSGSLNWQRTAWAETRVVVSASRGIRSTTTGRRPDRARKKAVAVPTIPPPITTTSAVAGRASV